MDTDTFSEVKVLVIGDIILDQYIYGSVTRRSPEADVPIIEQSTIHSNLGGAGNVALNIKSLGAEVLLVGGIGTDTEGNRIINLLENSSISPEFLITTPNKCTTTKTRVIHDREHLLRVDKEDKSALDAEYEDLLISKIKKALDTQSIDVIILQDYNKGILTEGSIPRILNLIKEKNIPLVVDPKEENFFAYRGATLFKPNIKELQKAFPESAINTDTLKSISNILRNKIDSQYNMITLGEKGLFLDESNNEVLIPAHPINEPDVCGAGDAVISITALAIAKKYDLNQIANLSNKAGYLACTKIGVHPIAIEEL